MKPVDATAGRFPGRRVVTVLLLAGAVAAGVFHVFRSPVPDSQPDALTEMIRDDLEREGAVLRIRDDGTIFSGYLVSHYPDGTLRSRSRVVDGKLHGLSEGWYADGTPEIREAFHEGVSHGVRYRWHPNGEMASRTEIEDGRLHGEYRFWREDGTLFQLMSMRDDRVHGVSKAYFPSGYLQARAEVDRGVVIRRESWDDGIMSDEGKNPNSENL